MGLQIESFGNREKPCRALEMSLSGWFNNMKTKVKENIVE